MSSLGKKLRIVVFSIPYDFVSHKAHNACLHVFSEL